MPQGMITMPVQVVYPNGTVVPIYVGKGARVNVTAGASASAATAIPADSALIILRATNSIYLKFGTSGVAATADANSILFIAGELVYPVPESSAGVQSTHFSVMRVGSADVLVQMERVA